MKHTHAFRYAPNYRPLLHLLCCMPGRPKHDSNCSLSARNAPQHFRSHARSPTHGELADSFAPPSQAQEHAFQRCTCLTIFSSVQFSSFHVARPSRLSLTLRLSQLPHDVLADLAKRLCSNSPALHVTMVRDNYPTDAVQLSVGGAL